VGAEDDIVNRLKVKARQAAEVFAERGKSYIRDSLSQPYPPASKPGEIPHRRSGRLMAAVTATVEEQGDQIRVKWGNTAPYSGFLESGTGRMAARPFIRPASAHLGPQFVAHMREAMRRK
jgi:HK97 gp10 family phage protein